MESLVIDFSNVPLRPINKREISLLEIALVVGSIVTLEIREILSDPIEKFNWIDNLSVAAASMARYASGMSISEIAQELDRSELLIKSHLERKTVAGKVVSRIYEKMTRGELGVVRLEQLLGGEEIERLRHEIERLRNENSTLKEKLSTLEQENHGLRENISKLENELKQLQATIDSLKARGDQLEARLNEIKDKLSLAKEQLSKIIETMDALMQQTI